MLIPENLCNRSPGFCALVIREEAPSPLPVGCLMDGLHQLTWKHSFVVAPCNILVLLLSSTGGPSLPGGLFRLSIPHQSRVETPLPEVHPPGDPFLDILFPADTQYLRENDVGKDKGPLGVPTPTKSPPSFCCQYFREAAPHCS